MKKQIKLFSVIFAAILPFTAKADTCHATYNSTPFFRTTIWQGDDITPPYVKCSYNKPNPRHRNPTYSYTLPGRFAPVSGRWLTYNGQSECFYGGDACVFTMAG